MSKTIGILLIATAAYFCGFAYFYRQSETISCGCADFDAVVVLTGGRGRITRGVHLWRKAPEAYLMISGVDKKFTPEAVLQQYFTAQDYHRRDQIILDYDARTTRENAAEVAAFTKRYNLGRIVVVTSDYHYYRARMEMAQALDQKVDIRYDIIKSGDISRRDWCQEYKELCVYLVEYNKLVGRYMQAMAEYLRQLMYKEVA